MAENIKKRRATKKRFQDAFMHLFSQYDMPKISVTMLCNEAGLHRSTFYLYYSSVDELLREIEQDILTRMKEYTQSNNLFRLKSRQIFPKDLMKLTEAPMIEFYEWQYSIREYLNPLLGPYGDPYFIQHYEELISDDILPALQYVGYDEKRQPYILKFITGGVMKANQDFLKDGDISARDLVFLIRTMLFQNPML